MKKTATPAPWFSPPEMKISDKRVAVIGAGIAGCTVAKQLHDTGWEVTVFDEAGHIATCASGNPAGIMMPAPSPMDSPEGRFYQRAFEQTRHVLQQLEETGQETLFHPCGVTLPHKPTLVNPLFEQSGWLSPPKVCRALLADCRITPRQRRVTTLIWEGNHWQLRDQENVIGQWPVVILCNGHKAAEFLQTQHLPITPARGQISHCLQTHPAINQCISGKSYLTPAEQGVVFGATFERGVSHSNSTERDTQANRQALHRLHPELMLQGKVTQRASVRATTQDHLPICGPLPDLTAHQTQYQHLHHGQPMHHYPKASYLLGLFISAGLGSRGLCSAAYCASLIGGILNQTLSEEDQHQLARVHPGRFIIRQLRKKPADRQSRCENKDLT